MESNWAAAALVAMSKMRKNAVEFPRVDGQNVRILNHVLNRTHRIPAVKERGSVNITNGTHGFVRRQRILLREPLVHMGVRKFCPNCDYALKVAPMTDSSSIPDEVQQEVKLVRDQVWDVSGQWRLFTGLFASQDKVDALNWAFNLGAGGLIHQAISTELAVGLGRLLDPPFETVKKKERHNLTIERMVYHLEKHKGVKQTEMRVKLDELRQLYKPHKLWRDKHHAHRDHAVTMKLETMEQVEQEAIDRLLSALWKLMDEICLELGGYNVSPKPYEGVAEQLLAFILPKYQESRERLGLVEAALRCSHSQQDAEPLDGSSKLNETRKPPPSSD